MCFGRGGGSNNQAQAQADAQYQDQVAREEQLNQERRAQEVQRQQNIASGTSSINNWLDSTFTPDFFSRRAADYENFAVPQLDTQKEKARRDLIFALANSGLTRSTAAATPLAELERQYGTQRQQIADRARSYADEARSGVESARGSLIQQLQATGDAGQAYEGARTQVPVLAAVPAFNPLGQVFTDVAGTVGLARNAAQARDLTTAGTRLFNAGQDSGRVVRG